MTTQLDPYVSESVNIDPRTLGTEMLLLNYPEKNSAPRSDMTHKQLMQAMLLKGGEQPFQFTGWESIFGEYEFDKTRRTQDAEVLAVIPKYRSVSGMHQINENPTLTVIYLGLDDRKIHYFNVDAYTKCSDGYGYYNKTMNRHMLSEGRFLPKETVLSTSPIHDGNAYGLGINVNAAYISLPETIDDAILISQSVADRMESRAIHTMTIRVSPGQHPLNLYGDENEFKFFPDIGEVVNEDGIVCGFRTPSDSTFMSDTLDSELCRPHYMHDMLYRAPPGSVVLDVDCYMNKCKVPKHLYTQIEKYTEADNIYFRQIVEVYKKYKLKNAISPAFSTLVTKAISRLSAAGIPLRDIPFKSNTKLVSKDTAIDFLQIDITYTHPIDTTLGFKITGRDGNKGVVCSIWPDEDMPVDDFGIRAGICIDPCSPFNRMNPGQLYEQFINRVSEFVRRELVKTRSYEYLMDYFRMINPKYSELVSSLHPTVEKQQKFIQGAIDKGIYLNILPALKTITPKLILDLNAKYQPTLTPVTYTLTHSDGTTERIRTKKPVCIGSKYLYLLYKMPEAAAAGISYINQYRTPVRPSSAARHLSPISQTPLRFGEDEIRIMTAATDPVTVMRWMCLHANSPVGVDKMIEAQLTADKPSRIDRIDISNEELVTTNTIVGIVHHMFATLGIDSRNVATRGMTKSTRTKYFKDLKGLAQTE